MPHELPKSYEPGAIETHWAEYWVKEKLFSVPTPGPGEKRPVFTLLLPPPNVTGRLHMGHMLNQTQMDIIVRWHRMRGFVTLWLPGTDHAGIATQMMVEKQLESEGIKRRELGREKFIERVWEWKKHYGGAILDQMKRLGASVDWDRLYFTMDENLSRAVREVFVRLYEEGLIYRGKYIVNWCPWHGTAISDLEVKHEEVAGKLWDIRYPVIGSSEFITVATTRPETMLGDTAVAVNPKDERYLHLHGKKVLLPLMKREIPIITDELAQPEFGTGAVKVTPAHDPNDFAAGKRHDLPQIDVMDEHAHMNQNAGVYAGLDRFEARKRVLEDLRKQGFLVAEKDYKLALGKCDRCGTVIEPRLSEQWFVKIKPLAERAKRAVENGEITIVPDNFRQIYLNWMANIYDWCISRQLWWGHRIPAWTCAKCQHVTVVRETPLTCDRCGSTELEQVPDVLDTWFSSGLLPFTTLGWPEKTRDLEVFYPNTLMITGFDILFFWLARMIMFGCHFMQGHRQDAAIKNASGEGEKGDDSVPFRHVYIHALVRDAERQKMSKTKGNVLDPLEVIERFGTDATRFTLAAMAAPGTDIAFNEGRTDGYRAFANKIWNAARFMFMNVDRLEDSQRSLASVQAMWGQPPKPVFSLELGARPEQSPGSLRAGVLGFTAVTLEDHWILSRFNRVAADVNAALETYRFHEAANRIYDFFWGEFCDWYLELIKPRLQRAEPHNKLARLAAGEDMDKISTELEAELAELREEVGPERMADAERKTEQAIRLYEERRATRRAGWRENEFGNAMANIRDVVAADREMSATACKNLVSLFDASLRLLHPVMPFITEEIWQAMYEGQAPLKSIALAAYPQADEKQFDLAAETEMSILQDLIVNVRNLRAELKVESKLKVPIEVFVHEPEIRTMIEHNRGAVERLANVEKVTFVEGSLAKLAGSRSTSRFDVHVVHERKIDVAAECERLKKELEKIEKELANNQKQLGNEQFRAKAPAHVVEGLGKRGQELLVLREKTQSKLRELGCA
ncbi:MAG TPA: valine--tRNA ligase [Candidatus Sulfotelmatobacter sp.]|nr:valine--tRNA ligase [Candidatus Sulfotelmatobacter sp.]